MKVVMPRGADVRIPFTKIRDYLLAPEHPVGGAKASYFESRGYSAEDAHLLTSAIREVARGGAVVRKEATRWGTKYLVVAEIDAPDGNPLVLGTAWMFRGTDAPVLVTAYPMRSAI